MEPTAVQLGMRSRVRWHMAVSTLGVIVGIGILALGGPLGTTVFGEPRPAWLDTVPLLGLVVIVVVGLASTLRNLRCPACGGLVAFQVSARYSAFAAMASPQCRHCGQKIFADRTPGSIRTMVWTIAAVIVGLIVIGAVAAVLTSPGQP